MPNDLAVTVHQQDAIISAPGRASRTGSRRDACSGHQSKIADTLGVIGAHNRGRTNVRWAAAELPDNFATAVNFDDPVVELVRDQNVPGLIESTLVVLPLAFTGHGRR